MDSSNSHAGSDSLTVEIKDVVAYILGDEKIPIPLSKLTDGQVARLLFGYAERVKAYIRHAGKSFEDIADGLEFKSNDFSILLPDGVSFKTRVFQLSVAYYGGLPTQPPPTAEGSSWLTHTLFVSEKAEFMLASLAFSRGRLTQFNFEILDTVGLAQFISFHKIDLKGLLEHFGRMWKELIARQDERFEKIRERNSVHQSVMERIV